MTRSRRRHPLDLDLLCYVERCPLLPPVTRESVREHLRSCSLCRLKVSRLRRRDGNAP